VWRDAFVVAARGLFHQRSGIDLKGQGKDQWGQKLANPFRFPAFDKSPTAKAYWDVFWYPPMTEFTPQQPLARNSYVWGYLAAAPRPE